MGAIAAEFNAMVTELREARHRLDEEAESRARLQRALQEADKLITVGQLSAGLAHEIGSPLQILNGRARVLLAHAQDPGKLAETRKYLFPKPTALRVLWSNCCALHAVDRPSPLKPTSTRRPMPYWICFSTKHVGAACR